MPLPTEAPKCLDDNNMIDSPSIFQAAHDLFAPDSFLSELFDSGLYPYFRPIERNEGTRAIVDGHEVIMAGSNNYLGLTTDPRVKEAASNAIKQYGTGCTGSRFLNGTLDLHLELEEKLAAFMRKPSCILFSTGYMTNMGVVQSLATRGDIIFSDKDNHSSIIAGTQVSTAESWRYRHSDMNHLRQLLQKATKDFPSAGKLIVSDGVFSMSGKIAQIPELVKLTAEFDAALMLDDAHAVAVMGDGGRGSASHFGLEDEVAITTGTFSKSFSSIGGFAVGDKEIIEYIRLHASVHIFSASMPPSCVATVLKCLEILQEEPWRLKRLWDISNYMREGFRSAGFNVWTSQAPIIPVVIGFDMDMAFRFWNELLKEGVFCNPVVPWRGAIAGGRSIMRTSYMATHTDEDLDHILEAFYRVGKRFNILSNNGQL